MSVYSKGWTSYSGTTYRVIIRYWHDIFSLSNTGMTFFGRSDSGIFYFFLFHLAATSLSLYSLPLSSFSSSLFLSLSLRPLHSFFSVAMLTTRIPPARTLVVVGASSARPRPWRNLSRGKQNEKLPRGRQEIKRTTSLVLDDSTWICTMRWGKKLELASIINPLAAVC